MKISQRLNFAVMSHMKKRKLKQEATNVKNEYAKLLEENFCLDDEVHLMEEKLQKAEEQSYRYQVRIVELENKLFELKSKYNEMEMELESERQLRTASDIQSSMTEMMELQEKSRFSASQLDELKAQIAELHRKESDLSVNFDSEKSLRANLERDNSELKDKLLVIEEKMLADSLKIAGLEKKLKEAVDSLVGEQTLREEAQNALARKQEFFNELTQQNEMILAENDELNTNLCELIQLNGALKDSEKELTEQVLVNSAQISKLKSQAKTSEQKFNELEEKLAEEEEKYHRLVEQKTEESTRHNDYVEELRKKGTVALTKKKYEEALDLFSVAIVIEKLGRNGKPTIANLWNFKGLCYGQLKRYEKAIESFSAAIEFDSSEAGFFFNRGLAYYPLKDETKAQEDMKKALELRPDYKDAKALLTQLESNNN